MHTLKNVTIVFVSYFSHNKIYKFLKNISSVIPVIILEKILSIIKSTLLIE